MTKGKSEAPFANSAGTEIRGTSIGCVLFAKSALLAVLAYGNLGCEGKGIVAHSLNGSVGSDRFYRGMRMMIVNDISLSRN